MLKFIQKIFFWILLFSYQILPQSFGFGCLGFVGGFGGYVYQSYDAAGLNKYITGFNMETYETMGVLNSFDNSTGFRVGLNLFRATFNNNIVLTAKGYYQALYKTNTSRIENENNYNYTLDLDIRNWSLGFDVGWEFTEIISWKILDGSLNFNNVTLTQTSDLPGESDVNKYKSDSGVLGYSLGTGIIVAVLKDYVSIEGIVGYSQIVIENVFNDSGTPFLNSNYNEKFIDSGGFSAVIQLNVGFPL
jgi:hypothetical protein